MCSSDLAFCVVPDIALRFEVAKYGENGGVGEFVGQLFAHFGHSRRTEPPQDFHEFRFSVGENDMHGAPLTMAIVVDTFGARMSTSAVVVPRKCAKNPADGEQLEIWNSCFIAIESYLRPKPLGRPLGP